MPGCGRESSSRSLEIRDFAVPAKYNLYAEVTGLGVYEAAAELAEKTGNDIPYK